METENLYQVIIKQTTKLTWIFIVNTNLELNEINGINEMNNKELNNTCGYLF